ncbi:MAG: formate C-acetyltransferase/glycerol dehydratase family glycyl radical enzyme, partial [Chloroflexi bacterium]|nr:formate C-acetyltransferase/glycerol dehydratase family glycyl radical enzyme [Chloroflexota bacterium]
GELLACVFVKMNDRLRFDPDSLQEFRQDDPGQYVALGGVTADGRDATNELSFLILEVARQLKLKQPSIAIRWHANIDESLLLKGVEVNLEIGGGIPSFINDENVIPNLVSLGIALQDARSYCLKGCVHPMVPGTHMFAGPISPSPVKILELTLNDGVDPLIGEQIGIATGDPRTFTSYEELVEAFKKQFTYWVQMLTKSFNILHQTRNQTAAYPFLSAVQRDCIQAGKDIGSAEVGYPLLYTAVNLRGMQTVANSLAAMKRLVFEDHRVTMDELLDALSKNFEGYEELRQLCLAAPKWGNDDDYVDKIHVDLWSFSADMARREFVTPWGGGHLIRGGATFHYFAGRTVGATPDGRKAFQPVADGTVSASYGTDARGPTATINSALKLDHSNCLSSLFNLKFPSTLLASSEDRRKLLALLRCYFEEGGYHLQFNIIGSEALREAQRRPESFRDLIVRVAGFSAYFVDLPLPVQNEIIARTEHRLQ